MDPRVSALAKLLCALMSGALAFAVATGSLILMGGLFEGWMILACFAAAPAALIAVLPTSARLFCFALGLVVWMGGSLMDLSGPHNPMTLIPWIAVCVAGAALVAELCIRSFLWLAPSPAGEGS